MESSEAKDKEALGCDVIDQTTIAKAFGNSQRAAAIREYIGKNTGVKTNKEVEFKYTAKVLVIFMRRKTLQDPFSSADLVNRGVALQQLMGQVSKSKVK